MQENILEFRDDIFNYFEAMSYDELQERFNDFVIDLDLESITPVPQINISLKMEVCQSEFKEFVFDVDLSHSTERGNAA